MGVPLRQILRGSVPPVDMSLISANQAFHPRSDRFDKLVPVADPGGGATGHATPMAQP